MRTPDPIPVHPASPAPPPALLPVLPPRRGEAGSAYIIALLVLVVLTIFGLALTLTTQMEVQIGANDRLTTRSFYAGDSGPSNSVARVLVTRDYEGAKIVINGTTGGPALSDRGEVTPMVTIGDSPCNLCQINQGNEYYSIHHALTSTGSRTGLDGSTQVELSQKRIALMMDLEPWQHSPQSMRVLGETAELAKLHF